jgi:hypothetical protein
MSGDLTRPHGPGPAAPHVRPDLCPPAAPDAISGFGDNRDARPDPRGARWPAGGGTRRPLLRSTITMAGKLLRPCRGPVSLATETRLPFLTLFLGSRTGVTRQTIPWRPAPGPTRRRRQGRTREPGPQPRRLHPTRRPVARQPAVPLFLRPLSYPGATAYRAPTSCAGACRTPGASACGPSAPHPLTRSPWRRMPHACGLENSSAGQDGRNPGGSARGERRLPARPSPRARTERRGDGLAGGVLPGGKGPTGRFFRL